MVVIIYLIAQSYTRGTHTHTHTHTQSFNNHFSGKPGLILSLHWSLSRASSWLTSKIYVSPVTQTHQVFLGCPVCLVSSVSINTHHLIQSASSLHSSCLNHRNLPLLIDRLTDFSHSNSLSSVFSFLSFKVNPYIHLSVLISFLSNFTLCSTFIGQVSLPLIIQLLTQLVYSLPSNINRNCFLV